MGKMWPGDLKESANSCCSFSFWYLSESSPFPKAETELKNCFVLWWIFFFFSNKQLFCYIQQLSEQRLATSALTLNRQSCRGCNDHVRELTLLWHVCMKSAFPAGSRKRKCMFHYHLVSIMTISIFCLCSSEMNPFYYKSWFHMTAFFM